MTLQQRSETPIHLRAATAADLGDLMALVRRVVPIMNAAGNFQWADDYPTEAIFAQDIQLGELWVAELRRNHCVAAGIAAVVAITREQPHEYAQAGLDLSEPALVIHRLAVDPSLRGQGFARKLLLQAEIVARESDIRILRVDTAAENPVMQHLLSALDYRFAGNVELDERPGDTFLCYEKRLMA